MYANVKNATDILGVDLMVFKTADLLKIFPQMIRSGKPIYYCRVIALPQLGGKQEGAAIGHQGLGQRSHPHHADAPFKITLSTMESTVSKSS